MITFSKYSGVYILETSQVLNVSIDRAWHFFSTPENLQKITPDYMGFQITSPIEENVYEGQIITYKVGVLPGIKTNWVTEITNVNPNTFFIDEQRFGPYKMWHHEHRFESLSDNKVLMTDKITYKIPYGIFGDLAHVLFVQKQLKGIFKYRFRTLEKLFNER